MRVVVTGATGNVGTSTIAALRSRPEVEEITGIARRRPAAGPEGVRWVRADIAESELAPVFEGAGAVIHLAWAIQPSRNPDLLRRINVDGTARVFDAVVAAGVPRLVHASSIGAYSPGPKDEAVDESWPTGGIESSFYSRHKVAAEEMLDDLERREPGLGVVRLRPALIFKGEAATEIRRLFAGPFLPGFLLGSRLLPVFPRIAGLRFQAVHSRDVGEAFATAALGETTGAFNLAAEPPLDSGRIAELLGARTFPLPAPVARALTDLSWRARLQPSPPGWLDMALRVPLIDSRRARNELGWEPRVGAEEAFAELMEGIGAGRGGPTPPLREAGLRGRADEVRSGVGARPWAQRPEKLLIGYLADAHSIERQALIQMKAAPALAGADDLAQIFERHREETEVHEQRVLERLEAHGANPSKLKDVAGWGGGVAMAAFARLQPETPGKLAAHAFSYEHMELAAYELLGRLAEREGDEETVAAAAAIATEEREMGERIASRFDRFLDASLGDDPDLEGELLAHLADAHAIERQAEQLLSAAPKLSAEPVLKEAFRDHAEETKAHLERLEGRLESLGGSPSSLKDAALRLGAFNLAGFLGAQPDTTTKLAGFAFAFEHLEVASYELLRRLAERAGDPDTVAVAERTLREERAAAERIASVWRTGEVPLALG